MLVRFVVVLLLLLFLIPAAPAPVWAQALNIDLGAALAAGPPSETFGGASGQGGYWNDVGTSSTFLDDLEGNPTSSPVRPPSTCSRV